MATRVIQVGDASTVRAGRHPWRPADDDQLLAAAVRALAATMLVVFCLCGVIAIASLDAAGPVPTVGPVPAVGPAPGLGL